MSHRKFGEDHRRVLLASRLLVNALKGVRAGKMTTLVREFRISLRRLWQQRGLTITAVLTLAVGIGAATSLFTVLDAVLLRPLPYSHPDRLALLWEVFPGSSESRVPSGEINLPVWREEFDSIESLSSFKLVFRNLTEPGMPRRLRSWDVSPNLFDTLGVEPELGRTFQAADARPGAEPVVLLSGAFWERAFGADPSIVGQPIWLDGEARRVVGVLKEESYFPPPLKILGGTHSLSGEIFVPAIVNPDSLDPRRNLALIVKIASGKKWTQAQTEIASRASRVAEAYPEYNPPNLSAVLAPIHEQAVSDSRPVLLLASAAVGVILLIACMNVANLLLAKGLSRIREVAVRMALGASRLQIVQQLMVENLILAIWGGVVGSLLALWASQASVVFISGHLPQLGRLEFTGRAWSFSCGASLLTVILFGLLPAMRVSRNRLPSGSLSGRAESSSIRPILRPALVISEVSLAVVLLVFSGFMLQSLWKLQRVETGFDPSDVMSFTIMPSQNRYPEPRQHQQLIREVLQSVSALPIVTAAGAVSGLPLSGDREGIPVEMSGRPTSQLEERLASMTALRFITPGYFSTLRIPLLAGRDVDENDRESSVPVAVVDRSFVDRFLDGREAVGSRITFDDDQDPNAIWREIIGVVEDVTQESLSREPEFLGTVYVPHAQMSEPGMTFVVRSAVPTAVLARTILGEFRRLDPQLAVETARLQDLVDQALAPHRTPTMLLTCLGLCALLLAEIGLYGVISFVVTASRKEIGIRMALGADSGRIFKLFVLQTSRWTIIGIAVGLAVALASNRLLSGLLFDVSTLSIGTYAVVAGIFLVTSAAAACIPALRASRVPPSTILQEE